MPARKPINPAPDEGAAVRNLHGVRRVKMRANIQQSICMRLKAASVGIKITNKILHLSIRRDEKHPTIAEFEKVGTLGGPRPGIGNLIENAAIFPLQQIGPLRLVNIHYSLAAFRLVQVPAQHHERPILVLENEWITPVIDFSSFVESFCQNGIGGNLTPRN